MLPQYSKTRVFGNQNVLNMSMAVQDATLEGTTKYKTLSKAGDPWPDRTDVCCWHCCHKFSNKPMGIPVDDNIRCFRLMGVFCSIECALAWAVSAGKHHTDYMSGARVKNLAKILFDIEPEDIRPASDRLSLRMFGGTLSIEEFRKNHNKYTIVGEPFVSSHMLLCVESSSIPTAQDDQLDQNSADTRQAERRFCVTGLRKPERPLPVEKILCEQDIQTKTGAYVTFMKEKGLENNGAPQAAVPAETVGKSTVISKGSGSLVQFLK